MAKIAVETPEVKVNAKEILVNERMHIGEIAFANLVKAMKDKFNYGALCEIAEVSEIVITLRPKQN